MVNLVTLDNTKKSLEPSPFTEIPFGIVGIVQSSITIVLTEDPASKQVDGLTFTV